MILSLIDFRIALSAADFFSEVDENKKYSLIERRRFKCYETTMIVAYARPFSKGQSNLPRLSIKMCNVSLSDKERVIHEKILKLRKKAFAHSDIELARFKSVVRPLSIGKGENIDIFYSVHQEGLHFFDLEICYLINLIRKVLFGLEERIQNLAQQDPELWSFVVDYLDQQHHA